MTTNELSGSGGNPYQTRRLRPATMLVIMIVPLLIVLGLGWALIEANRGQITTGAAPDFQVKTYNGGDFKLSDQRGKVVVINFWASWCGPCRTEEPELNALWDEYQDRGVILIGLGWNDNDSEAAKFIQEFGMKYLIGTDTGGVTGRAYGVKGVPETYVVDKHGNIVRTFLSPVNLKELRSVLDNLIAQ